MLDLQIISHELRIHVKNLDYYSRADQNQLLEKLAFDFYLRKGIVPPQLIALQKLSAAAKPGFKFNPYHDDLGRFTFAPDGGDDDDTNDNGDNSGGDTAPIADPGAGDMQLVQEVVPPDFIFGKPPVTIRPPFEELPQDPEQPPGPGFEWKGKGPPGSGEGSWTNPSTRERLYPDMDNEEHGPHWDYRAPDGSWYRWYPDGRMEPKIIAGGEIA